MAFYGFFLQHFFNNKQYVNECKCKNCSFLSVKQFIT